MSASNGAAEDEFLRLEKPQQDVLLVHGPRKRYSLEEGDIPELRSEREVLIQVLAIGLNPVDWKGVDYSNYSKEDSCYCHIFQSHIL